MKPAPLMLLTCLALGGCTALGKMGQVIMDPSIQVGGPGDQLSQFSLSLYASPTLNPNPSSAVDEPLLPNHLQPTPLAVSLSAGDSLELTQKLQALLDHLHQQHPAMSHIAQEAPDEPAMSPVDADLGSYEAPYIPLGLKTVSAPVLSGDVTTPVAFKVLQLKDDSLLLNAAYELLEKDLEKALGSTLVQVDDYRLLPGQFKFVGFEQIHEHTRYLAVIANYHDRDKAEWKRALRIEPQGRQHALLVQFEEHGVVLKNDG
ncbi:type VI secretion system lipoprotein TssJ [Pseudomonas sp. MAFF212428]|uniref:Type VI secretion system lipoprotein TssJ n=1 Tax=Pseudomonas brassicae TaxID=2708063 RepID=A0A6B3NSN8_9PSED|nr:type VI secretion system lipoprotein TssJ [Pseudomonas brassicae]NER60169.1 type VI secretion system lipoprotein TssJ [Pseudomonas brassicae]NER65149.1 type VI secretion system lipoprotein TssJ [Pseudomonas brassicae]